MEFRRVLFRSIEVFRTDDRKQVAAISGMDNILDRLNDAIKRYLAEIDPGGLDDEDNRRCSDILDFTVNLEHVGDIVDKSLMPLAAKKIKRRLSFSEERLAEIRELHGRLLDNLQLALAVFMEIGRAACRAGVWESV